jgi:hypothetical protein
LELRKINVPARRGFAEAALALRWRGGAWRASFMMLSVVNFPSSAAPPLLFSSCGCCKTNTSDSFPLEGRGKQRGEVAQLIKSGDATKHRFRK